MADKIGSGCRKTIEVFVPRGMSGKMIKYRCGNTGIDGYPVLCEDCEKTFSSQAYRENCEANGERIEDDY